MNTFTDGWGIYVLFQGDGCYPYVIVQSESLENVTFFLGNSYENEDLWTKRLQSSGYRNLPHSGYRKKEDQYPYDILNKRFDLLESLSFFSDRH